MIQRIQTLLLLIVAVLTGVLCLVPFATFLRDGELFRQTVWGIHSAGQQAVMVVRTTPMGILAILATLLPLVIIFLFKKRELQMRLCVVEIILLVGLCVYMGMYLMRSGSDDISERVALATVDLFPLIAIVLTFIALKRITRDEILVRSLDRIR
jgi:hypothetical protein